MLYSNQTGGFYDTAIHGDNIPSDAVGITAEEYAALLEGQSAGKIISVDADGKPILTNPIPPTLDELITAFVKKIDADADAIYTAALGNRATEYAEAETQAQAFKDSAYAGTVPDYVQAWASATGKTAEWAANDILATASAWRSAQSSIRAQRLAKKAEAKAAADAEALEAIRAGWAAFVIIVRKQLGI